MKSNKTLQITMLRDQVSHSKVTEAKDRNFTQSIRIVTFSISIFSKRADQHFRLKKSQEKSFASVHKHRAEVSIRLILPILQIQSDTHKAAVGPPLRKISCMESPQR